MRLPGPPCASDLSGSPSGTRPHLRICPMPYPPGGHYQRRSQGTSRWTSASDTRKLGHPRCDRTPRCGSDPFPPARSRGVQMVSLGSHSQNRPRPVGWELESQMKRHWPSSLPFGVPTYSLLRWPRRLMWMITGDRSFEAQRGALPPGLLLKNYRREHGSEKLNNIMGHQLLDAVILKI